MECPFKLVLQSVDAERMAAAKRELARIFETDEDIAADIAGAAPIIILADLDLFAAATVRRRLEPLIAVGGRLVTTDAPCDDIPKVNWPELPGVAHVSVSERQGEAPPFEELAAFRCPACGETLRVVRTGVPAAAPRPLPHARSVERGSVDLRAPAPAAERAGSPATAPSLPPGSGAPVVPVPPPPPPLAPPERPASIPVEIPLPKEAQSDTPIPPPGIEAPRGPEPGPPLTASPPRLDSSPLLRALEVERVRRASVPAIPVPPLDRGGAATEPTRPPAPPSLPTPPVRSAPAEPTRGALGPLSPEGDHGPRGAPEPAGEVGVPEMPPGAPRGVADSGEALEDLKGFDIDAALKLLDNAPDSPAPAGAAVAPPPAMGHGTARASEGERDTILEDIESDVTSLEAALAQSDSSEDEPEPARKESRRAGSAPEPREGREGARRAGGGLLPLDPLEALSILESVKGPGSSENILVEPPKRPVSEELEPLDPNEALSILQAQVTPPPKTAGKTGTKLRPSMSGPGSLMPPPSPVGPTTKIVAAPAWKEPVPPPRTGYTGATVDAPLERRALVDSGELDFDPEPEPPSRPEPPKPATQQASREKRGPAPVVTPPKRKPPQEPDADAPVHGLVLSKITGDARRQKAAELIAELTSIPKGEALKLTDRTIIPVLKGVSKEEAEAALRRFERSKISGRVTTRRVGD